MFAGLGGASLATLAALVYVQTGRRAARPLMDIVAELDAAARPLVHTYGLFATGLLLVLVFWTYPRRRTRELAVVLILGPGTLLRPYWIVAGALWALAGVDVPLAALIVLVAAVQLGVEPMLNVRQARAQRLRMQRWGQ